MTEPIPNNVTQRLDRLERQLSWLRIIGISAVTILVLVVLFVMYQLSKPEKEIEAEKFLVRDSSGRLLGSFTGDGFGLLDENGKTRIGLGHEPKAEYPGGLFGPATVLALADAGGAPRLLLMVKADGTPVLAMFNKEGKVIWKAP